MSKLNIEISKGETCKLVSSKSNNNMFYGMPYGGAMDIHAANAAHNLLKQTPSLSLLECTFKGPTLKFNTDCKVAVTGADMKWELDKNLIEINQVLSIKAGQILRGKYASNGFRSYVAIDRSLLGMKSGIIQLGGKNKHLKVNQNQELVYKNTIDVYRGPEWNFLSQEGKETMIGFEGIISQDIDRMGAYIHGPKVKMKTGFPKQSVCTFPGIIQLLPSGQLIVLLQDAQTTGGYPRIAYLKEEALCLFNQISPGQKLKWRMII